MIKQQFTIGWKVSTLNLDLASLRYRAILPMLALDRFGIKGKIFNNPNRDSLISLDALVIVKSFTFEDYWLAQEAVKMKVPIIFDLCDNIFIDQYAKKNQISPSAYSGNLNTYSGKSRKVFNLKPESVFNLFQNRCSDWSGMGVQVEPEYAA